MKFVRMLVGICNDRHESTWYQRSGGRLGNPGPARGHNELELAIDIIAMGGGSVVLGETRALDEAFLGRSSVVRPRVLFIPTASMDDEEYVDGFTTAYSSLGAIVDVLRFHSGEASLARSKVDTADLIYVGGGNTKMMLQLWRATGFADYLSNAVQEGKPVGGLSAGAICWFRVGNSDWPQYEGIPGVNTARLPGLDLIPLAACPHTKNEGFRLSEFREMMRTEGGVGIGLDDNCAIHVRGEEFRILASQPNAVAHRIQWVEGALQEESLVPHDAFRPLHEL